MTRASPKRSARLTALSVGQAAAHAAQCLVLLGVLVLGACAETAAVARPVRERGPPPTQTGLREIFPHVRFDKDSHVVEIDGQVPIDCHNPKTPRVYLEVTVCTRNSKEHEALVVTDATPSHIHAALLLAGLTPGTPGTWHTEGNNLVRVPPRGDPVRVTIVYTTPDGHEVSAPAQDWVINARSAKPLSDEGPGEWVFAGSRMVEYQGREFYDADGTGTLVGLTTFGSETVAFTRVFSPESQVEEPEWIADPARVPAYLTRVVVRISPAKHEKQ